jgi:hypothetical protein
VTVVIVRQLWVWAATAATATLGALAWSLTAGSGVASASTRLRSGSIHAQLASHVAGGANALSSGLNLNGAGVMAAIVGALAVSSVAFLVVTFIRRRVTLA